MILIALGKNGTVVVKTRSRSCWVKIRELKYVDRIEAGLGKTWWTYLSDLRRDLPKKKVRYDPRLRARLTALVSRVTNATKGDDAFVNSCFGTKKPYPFQLEAIHAGLEFRRMVLADSTGLGKTIEALGILFAGIALGHIRRAVIVTPKGLKGQWYEEILDFAGDLPEPVVISSGDKAKRRILYKKPWRVLIVNPRQITGDFDALRREVRNVDLVVLDEASCIRNDETDLWYAMVTLFKNVRYKLAATATPVENRLHDLRSVIRFVEPRVFMSKVFFNSRYVIWKKVHIPVRKRSGAKFTKKKLVPKEYVNLEEIRRKIKPCYIRRRVSDVGLQLPKLIVLWERLELPPRQRKVYEAVRQRLEGKIAGLRGAALRGPLQALRQACNSTALVQKKGVRGRVGQVKVDRLKELLDTDLAGEQVVIFTDYERFGRILAQALRDESVATYMGPDGKRARQRAVDGFRLGDKRILIGTAALERGHNLQNAAVVLQLDLPWNPAKMKQRLGRIRRLGSKHETNRLINFMTRDTVEENLIVKKLYTKRSIFEAVLGSDELTEADPLESLTGTEALRFM